MGKPRMIILIRHAQSEGNKNRDIHQFVPDHRVKLTPDGWQQADEAGRRLRTLLKPDDTLQFFTSPYRRTRETTEGILRSLTSDDPTPSPFQRSNIKVFEEPRLREQDFGNFQPCSAEMERMWQERADYGHFFYRIPNGESAADAYDRVSGFNESMWRLFGEEDFPSVCVLVTHGLMTRVFLMKWYHWSVEYFEDLRNINHCEFIVMEQGQDSGKFVLQNELRTWSELKRRTASINTNVITPPTRGPPPPYQSPVVPTRRWGGCANGCNHASIKYPRKARRQNTADYLKSPVPKEEKEDTPIASQEADHASGKFTNNNGHSTTARTATHRSASKPPGNSSSTKKSNASSAHSPSTDGDVDDGSNSSSDLEASTSIPHTHQRPLGFRHLHPGRDFGGSRSGQCTPAEGFSDDSDWGGGGIPRNALVGNIKEEEEGEEEGSSQKTSSTSDGSASKSRPQLTRKGSNRNPETEQEWVRESGMGTGACADTLGDGGGCECGDDEHGEGDDELDKDVKRVQSLVGVLMAKTNGAGAGARSGVPTAEQVEEVVEDLKTKDRKSFKEVY